MYLLSLLSDCISLLSASLFFFLFFFSINPTSHWLPTADTSECTVLVEYLTSLCNPRAELRRQNLRKTNREINSEKFTLEWQNFTEIPKVVNELV